MTLWTWVTITVTVTCLAILGELVYRGRKR